MTYDEIIKQAFLDELKNIYAARGQRVDLEKFAYDPRIEAMLKEALSLRAVGEGIQQAGQAVGGGARKAYQAVSPAQRQLTKYRAAGVGDVAAASLKKQNPLRRAEQWGKAQRQTPVQRVMAARGAATSPTEKSMLTFRGSNVAKRQQMGDIQKATQQIGGTSLPGRLVGSGVEGAAAHVRHKPVMSVLNPFGVPLGGAAEGMTRQGGRELIAGGHRASGSALKRHAGKVGIAAEIGGVAGLGTALHAPVSAIGAAGGGLVSAAGHAVPLIEQGLHGAGELIHHGVSDVVGVAAKKMALKGGLRGAQAVGRAFG